MPDAAASFDEIRSLLKELPGPDLEAGTQAVERQRILTKPPGSLGRLEEIARFMATWQGRHPPKCDRPRVAVFAGNHGVAARGVSAYPAEVTAQMVRNFIAGGAAVNQLTAQIDGDLRVYEMDLEHPTGDFTQGPAMDEARCARAMAYGMMAVEPGIDLLCLGEMGIGNSTSAAALCLALFGGEAGDWTGPGTGVAGAALARKREAVADGVAANRAALGDPLRVLAALGGEELAAIAGAILAARLARVPVLLDGFACCAAAAIVQALDPRGLDHCLAGHLSAEPGHVRLLENLGMDPLLRLGMRLGEGSGAALAVGVVKAAIACHAGMASFAEAEISGRLA
ncbi:MAG: nicotinate-nucleotide--dimethylbenzimidazole phosphoribosyltransferase [Reyranellaceae bacterium]